MVLFISAFYDVRMVFHKIFELIDYTILFSQINEQNQTTKQLNYEIIAMYIYMHTHSLSNT